MQLFGFRILTLLARLMFEKPYDSPAKKTIAIGNMCPSEYCSWGATVGKLWQSNWLRFKAIYKLVSFLQHTTCMSHSMSKIASYINNRSLRKRISRTLWLALWEEADFVFCIATTMAHAPSMERCMCMCRCFEAYCVVFETETSIQSSSFAVGRWSRHERRPEFDWDHRRPRCPTSYRLHLARTNGLDHRCFCRCH
jgi:hypothetical protein